MQQEAYFGTLIGGRKQEAKILLKKKRKWYWVRWSEGTIDHGCGPSYQVFMERCASSGLMEAIRKCFHENSEKLSRKAESVAGHCSGTANGLDESTAFKFVEIIATHYINALASGPLDQRRSVAPTLQES